MQKIITGFALLASGSKFGSSLEPRFVVYQLYSCFAEPIFFFVMSIVVLNIIFSYTDTTNFIYQGYSYRRGKFSTLIKSLIVLGALRLAFQFYCMNALSIDPSNIQNTISYAFEVVKSAYRLLSNDIIPLFLLGVGGALCNTYTPLEYKKEEKKEKEKKEKKK